MSYPTARVLLTTTKGTTMTYSLCYTVKGYDPVVLSGLDAQGVADSIVYASKYGDVNDVSISTY